METVGRTRTAHPVDQAREGPQVDAEAPARDPRVSWLGIPPSGGVGGVSERATGAATGREEVAVLPAQDDVGTAGHTSPPASAGH